MNDGNIQSTIPTEEDMNKVRSIFERGINAIVDASQLRQEVEGLRQTINEIRADLDKLRQQNAWLDEQLLRVRQERDTALSEARQAKADLEEIGRANTNFKSDLDQAYATIRDKGEIISHLTQERDDSQMRVLELEDTVGKLQGKLERFLALADEFDPPQEPELMQPTPMVIPPVIIQEPTDNYEPWRNRA